VQETKLPGVAILLATERLEERVPWLITPARVSLVAHGLHAVRDYVGRVDGRGGELAEETRTIECLEVCQVRPQSVHRRRRRYSSDLIAPLRAVNAVGLGSAPRAGTLGTSLGSWRSTRARMLRTEASVRFPRPVSQAAAGPVHAPPRQSACASRVGTQLRTRLV
jgi:hypothetical protein